ncbi:MAG: ribonuclease D [Rickettsiales bacterium]|nr:ribonuclease D [Rickettsiales bacterium]
MSYTLHINDLPDGLDFGSSIAIDTETLGLKPHRDRLCVIQLSSGDGTAHLVKFNNELNYQAPNLKKLLNNPDIQKIFHFARFDVAVIKHYLAVDMQNIFCTKIASRLTRTYTDYHGLKDICSELLGVSISKAKQCSNWASADLSDAQLAYAAQDVLFLHDLKHQLLANLESLNRLEIAQQCFDFLTTRANLDLIGFEHLDIFAH